MPSCPTTPEPRVRLTTLIGCFRSFSIRLAMMRAVASVPPPAPQGTMSWIGRWGYWACAALMVSAARAAASLRMMCMEFLLDWTDGCWLAEILLLREAAWG